MHHFLYLFLSGHCIKVPGAHERAEDAHAHGASEVAAYKARHRHARAWYWVVQSAPGGSADA